jgi:predicted dehydrogenase
VTAEGKPLRVAVVGCGNWGRNYIRVAQQFADVDLVGIAETDPARLASAAAMAPGASRYSNLDDMLCGAQGLDAVIVATEARSHAEVVRTALNARCHVLAEKPLTVDLAAAAELCRLADQLDLRLMVGHTFLFNSAIWLLRDLVHQNRLGRVYYVHATRTHLGPIREDVDAIWDLAAHDVAIFNYVLDSEPRQVSAVGAAYLQSGRRDIAFVSLLYPDGLVGHIHVSWLDANKERRVVLVGERCRVVFDDLNNLEKVRIFEKGIAVHRAVDSFGEFQYLLRDGDIISPKIDLREPLRVEVEEFLASIREARRPQSDGWTGLGVVRVLEAIQRSMAGGGAPVSIESRG